jgi:hypothetical protein
MRLLMASMYTSNSSTAWQQQQQQGPAAARPEAAAQHQLVSRSALLTYASQGGLAVHIVHAADNASA